MKIDSSVIGQKSEPKIFEVEKGAIRAFAEAIGDPNSLYTDESFAKEHGYRSLVAPPTFATTFRVANPVRFQLKRALHGGQEYRYERPVVAGDVLRCQSEVVDVYEKKGNRGTMTFLVTELRGEDLAGNLVFTAKTTAILR